MTKNLTLYTLTNVVTFLALILGGLGISEIAANLFIGITIFIFVATLFMCGLLFESGRVAVFSQMASEKDFTVPERSVSQSFDTGVDVALVLTSFAFGFWFCGIAWLFHAYVNVSVSRFMYDPNSYGAVHGAAMNWHRAEDRAPEPGQLRVMVCPKMDREAQLLNIPVLAQGTGDNMVYLMENGADYVKCLDIINDYDIVFWSHNDKSEV